LSLWQKAKGGISMNRVSHAQVWAFSAFGVAFAFLLSVALR
jgi:hypothetical protein